MNPWDGPNFLKNKMKLLSFLYINLKENDVLELVL